MYFLLIHTYFFYSLQYVNTYLTEISPGDAAEDTYYCTKWKGVISPDSCYTVSYRNAKSLGIYVTMRLCR